MSEAKGELLEVEYASMLLSPEVRPAIASVREPVLDEDGFVTHYAVNEHICVVHTLQVGRGGFVCEFEDGTVHVVNYESVRFVDGEED